MNIKDLFHFFMTFRISVRREITDRARVNKFENPTAIKKVLHKIAKQFSKTRA